MSSPSKHSILRTVDNLMGPDYVRMNGFSSDCPDPLCNSFLTAFRPLIQGKGPAIKCFSPSCRRNVIFSTKNSTCLSCCKAIKIHDMITHDLRDGAKVWVHVSCFLDPPRRETLQRLCVRCAILIQPQEDYTECHDGVYHSNCLPRKRRRHNTPDSYISDLSSDICSAINSPTTK